MKILIVDFDDDTIKNFITFLKQNFPEIKSYASVTDNGKDFMGVVGKAMPNLIIADVRFFGVNSVKIVREVRESYPYIKFILYGTYNETEYMQRCVQFGVIDYMYRPVKPTEFKRCMDMALSFLKKQDLRQKEEKELLKSYKDNLAKFEEMFLTSLLNGNIRNKNEIKYNFDYFNMSLEPNYTVFVVRIDHFQKIILTMDEKEKHLYSYKILLALKEILASYNVKVFMNMLNSFNVILSSDMDYEGIIEMCNNVKNELYKKLDVKVTLGVGRTYSTEDDIPTSYKEAENALNYRFYMGYNTVISIDFAEPTNTITYRYPTRKEERLVYFSVIGEYEYCKELVNDICNALNMCGELPEKLLPKIIMNILISISCYANELRLPINDKLTVFFPSKEVFEIDSVDKARSFLNYGFKQFCEYILKIHDELKVRLVKEAKEYILEKYNEFFSITKVAMHFRVTPEYLSNVFLESEKVSILDFTVSKRIEEAKKLMLQEIKDDELIALKVGYEEGRHFRSVFKQYTGMNTNDFRIQNNVI